LRLWWPGGDGRRGVYHRGVGPWEDDRRRVGRRAISPLVM
jgi:hypothetical protein